MKHSRRRRIGIALMASAGLALSVGAQETLSKPRCKSIEADLTEARSTVGCKPEHAFCFLGEVDGNRGLRGTTYFKGDAGAAGPSTSPGFISYSGLFEYITPRGTLVARETGVINQTADKPESGALTAYQQIIEATGELEGATGHFFVSGFSRNAQIVTKVTGQLCTADR